MSYNILAVTVFVAMLGLDQACH